MVPTWLPSFMQHVMDPALLDVMLCMVRKTELSNSHSAQRGGSRLLRNPTSASQPASCQDDLQREAVKIYMAMCQHIHKSADTEAMEKLVQCGLLNNGVALCLELAHDIKQPEPQHRQHTHCEEILPVRAELCQ